MRRYPVALPSKDQGWNWGYHSCNGLSAAADVKKWAEPELWKDVLAVHQKTPLHALVGGGDQIYNDALWSMPSMKAWLSIPSTEVKLPTFLVTSSLHGVAKYNCSHSY